MISNDSPINKPQDDQFGIDGFAQAIAKSIAKLSGPEGTTLAITGEWGSGKSSAINLVRYHLKPYEENGSIHSIVFNPWWYADEQLLTRAFFQHLYAGLGTEVSNEAQKLILSLGKKLSAPIVSAVANYFTLGLGGKLAERLTEAVADQIKTEKTVELEYEKVYSRG